MANITDVTQLFYGQVESSTFPNPRLAAPVTGAATSLTYSLTAPIFNESGVIPTFPFIVTFLNRNSNEPLSIYVADPSTELSADGLTITLASATQKNINTAGEAGIDFLSGTTPDFDLKQDSPFRISVSALTQQMLEDALTGAIGSTIKFNAVPTWDTAKTDVAATVPTYADATARDAGITTPVNGMKIYNTAAGVFQKYEGGAWVNEGSATTPNASATVAGKIEMATQAELLAGTATGGSGALLVPANDDTLVTESANFFNTTGITGAEAETLTDGSDASALHTHADTTSMSSANAGTLTAGAASNADGLHTHTNLVTNISHLVATLTGSAASGNQVLAHGLGVTPKFIKVIVREQGSSGLESYGGYDGSTNNCAMLTESGGGQVASTSGSLCASISYGTGPKSQNATATFDGTNVTLA